MWLRKRESQFGALKNQHYEKHFKTSSYQLLPVKLFSLVLSICSADQTMSQDGSQASVLCCNFLRERSQCCYKSNSGSSAKSHQTCILSTSSFVCLVLVNVILKSTFKISIKSSVCSQLNGGVSSGASFRPSLAVSKVSGQDRPKVASNWFAEVHNGEKKISSYYLACLFNINTNKTIDRQPDRQIDRYRGEWFHEVHWPAVP